MRPAAETIKSGAPVSEGASCLVLTEQYLPIRGGHVVWLHEVCRRLPGMFVVAGGGRPSEVEQIDGVPVRRVDFSRKWYLRPESLGMYVRMYRAGLREAKRQRPRVLLAARAVPEGIVARWIARKTGLPALTFAHGEEVNRSMPDAPLPDRHRFRTARKRQMLWDTYKAMDAIIANSRYTRELLVRGGVPEGKIHVIHPGTDPDWFTPGPKPADLAERLGVEGKKVVLSVGRLCPRKGQDRTIEAWPSVLRHVPDAVYLVAGTGEDEGRLRRLCRELGVESSVRLLGEFPQEELPKLYRLADIFIMASRQTPGTRDVEGFGIVFLEAGACGVPVVAGRCGGIPDAVEDGRTGMLVDGDSSERIAAALIELLSNEDQAAAMGAAGRQRVLERLTWDRSAEQIAELINSVALR